MKFEVVAANPPFSLEKWGYEDAKAEEGTYNRFHRGLPPISKGDYAFISHMVESTTMENGRVGVIVPHGVLFRGGTEGIIRTKFIEENLLDAVIGLPSNLFYGTGIPTAILIFKRNRNSYVATFDEIEGNEFNLNIPRYVDTFEEEEEVDIPVIQKEIEKIEKDLVNVRKEMAGYLKELGF